MSHSKNARKRSSDNSGNVDRRDGKRIKRDNGPPLLNAPAEPTSIAEGHQCTVLIHGSEEFGQLGLGTENMNAIARPRLHSSIQSLIVSRKMGAIIRMTVGGMFSLVLDANGRVWSWGVNDDMALGRRTQDIPDTDPEELQASPGIITGLDGFKATRVAAGDSLGLAVNERGQLRAWGSFRLSDGRRVFDGKHSAAPEPVALLPKQKICQIACGDNHALALSRNGIVFSWGEYNGCQLGRRIHDRHGKDALRPEALNLRNIVHIGSGYRHSFAVDKDGVVFGWGLNRDHQLGIHSSKLDEMGDSADMVHDATVVEGLHPSKHDGSRVIQITGGEFHSLFLFDNGELWGCGQNDQHAVGLPSDHPALSGQSLTKLIFEPTRISFPPPPTNEESTPRVPSDGSFSSTKISRIGADGRYSFACSTKGVLYSWGTGASSQLGLGADIESAELPTRVRSKDSKDYNVIDVACGGQVVLVSAYKPPA